MRQFPHRNDQGNIDAGAADGVITIGSFSKPPPSETDPLIKKNVVRTISAIDAEDSVAAPLSSRSGGSSIRNRSHASSTSRSPTPQQSDPQQQMSRPSQSVARVPQQRYTEPSLAQPNSSTQQSNLDPIFYVRQDDSQNNPDFRAYHHNASGIQDSSPSSPRRQHSSNNQQHVVDRQQYYNERANRHQHDQENAETIPGRPTSNPLLEVPEDIYTVRRAALTVLEPLTYTWLIITVGFSASLALGMAKGMYLLPNIPYWFILLPSWLSHFGLFLCYVMSARALSNFIAEANGNRQRSDTTDHLDRTEYLPLLQRSLKFGLKTGMISFFVFIFEILLYVFLAKRTMSFATVLIPIWIIVVGGTLDGIICKTQNFFRLFCWMLMFASMLLLTLKIDLDHPYISWSAVLFPIMVLLILCIGSLIYIVYGHQVGYFHLSESQLTAGILYALAMFFAILLLVVLGDGFLPMVHPVDFETRIFLVALAPVVMSLVGVGGWAISKDEFERLLQHGGQNAVHPMKLRLESAGWTSVESKGVTSIPMFGEVRYEPLQYIKTNDCVEMCSCRGCYPYEEEEQTVQYYGNQGLQHPYFSTSNATGGDMGRSPVRLPARGVS
mmetsp:Transcript_62012/g.72516  ORF Transcript_62012/g.72516 Transcript_62012/m.72516 type:complete len:610 (+) Transcript_62012:285-2114(+)